MKRIILLLLLLVSTVSTYAQQEIRYSPFRIWYDMAIGKKGSFNPDPSAHLDIGPDTSKKGVLLPKVILDSVNTTKRGLFVYSLEDSVLYHFDGSEMVRYMTFKDTSLLKMLSLLDAPTNPNDFLVEERRSPVLTFPNDTTAPHISMYVPKMVKVGDSIKIVAKADLTKQIYAYLYTTTDYLSNIDTAEYINVAVAKQPTVSGLERVRDPAMYYESNTGVGQLYYKGMVDIYRDTFTRSDVYTHYPTNGGDPVYNTEDARADFNIPVERSIIDLGPGSYIRYQDSSYLFISMGLDNPAEYWVVMLSSSDNINWTGRRIIAYPKTPYNQVLGPVVFRLKNQYNNDSTWYFSYPTSSEMMGDKTFSVISYAKSLYGQVFDLDGTMFYPTWDTTVFSNTRNYLSSILMKPDINGYNPYVFEDGHWLAAVSGTKSDGVTSERASVAKIYPTNYGKKDENKDTVTAYKVSARIARIDEIQGSALDYLAGLYEPLGTSVLVGGNDLSDMDIGLTQQGTLGINIDDIPMLFMSYTGGAYSFEINKSYKTVYWNFYGNSSSSFNILNVTPSTGSGNETGPPIYFYQRNTADNSWLDYARITPTYIGDGSSKSGGLDFHTKTGGGWQQIMSLFRRVQIYSSLVLGSTNYNESSSAPNGALLYASESFSNLSRPFYFVNTNPTNIALAAIDGNMAFALLENGSVKGWIKYDFVGKELYWSNVQYDGSGGKHIGLDYLNVFRHRNSAGTTLFSTDNNGNTFTLGKMSIGNVPEYADNAAAVVGGLSVGEIYRTGDNLKIVH